MGRRGGAGGRNGAAFDREAAAEAYQRRFHIVKQTGPGRGRRFLAGDKDIVDAGPSQKGKQEARGLPQAAARAVADNGPPDLAGGREPCPGHRARLRPAAGLDDQAAAALGDAFRDKQEFAARPEALDVQRG
jgi:hypothetical protein